jgi:hypothetical protein
MNLVELLTQQGLTARTLDSSKQLTEFEKAFLTSPLPKRLHRSSVTTMMSECDDDSDTDEEPTTPPSSPIHGAQLQTSALLHQVMQRLVALSLRTFETLATSLGSPTDHKDIDEHLNQQRQRRAMTLTPPSSPTFDGLVAPTPNTAMHAMKTSTFLRISSLNPLAQQSIRHAFTRQTSPGEIPLAVNELLHRRFPRL